MRCIGPAGYICPVASATLDRTSPLPLWAQLEADLQRRMASGEFDERFPTDAELTEAYAVSRHTVREAIRHLNRAGVLRRERGRGTVLNRTEFEQSLGAVYSLFRSVEESGHEQRSEVLSLGPVTAPVAAGQLGLAESAPLVCLERVRFADDAPLALDRTWLPEDVGTPLLDVDFSHTSLYGEMERAVGFRPEEGWERIAPVLPVPADRERLHLRRNQPCFALERLGRYRGRAVEFRNTVIRGDRYRFVADWSAGADRALRLQGA
jgi:GntR family transcriptional regulator